MDATDYKLLGILMEHGRASWADLAEATGLSAPSVAERVRRLENRGAIHGYAALVDGSQVGAPLTALVAVTLAGPDSRTPFLRVVHDSVEIQECHHTAGDEDYVLKVRCAGTAELEHLVSDVLKGVPGVSRTRTTVVLSTAKDAVVLPLPAVHP